MEIESVKLDEIWLQNKEKVENYRPFLKEEYMYIDTVEKLEQLILILENFSEIAVDLEHHSIRSY